MSCPYVVRGLSSVAAVALLITACASPAPQGASPGQATTSTQAGTTPQAPTGSGPTAQSAGEEYKIGASFPMTGPSSTFGTYFSQGAQFAIDEINAAGGVKGHPLKLVIEDHKSDPATGVNVFRKLVDVDKVPLVFVTFTAVSLAQLPVAKETKTVAYTAAVVTPGISKDNEWVFRSTVGADQEARTMATYMVNEKHLKRAAVVFLNTDQGLTGSAEFKKTFEQLGGQVVDMESYNNGAVDLRPQLTKVRAANPDSIYEIGLGQEMGLELKQASEMGLKVPQFGTSSIELPDVLKAAGDAAEGVVYTVGELDPQASKDFSAKYKARFGSEPEVWAGNHYDAMRMIAKAIETNGYSADGIRQGLLAIKDFPGVTGKTSFAGNQEATKNVGMKVIKDGKPTPLSAGS